MAYRLDNTPPPKPDDFKAPRLEVYNGAPFVWSFPCFYLEVEKPIDWHDYHMHDFLGWPAPDHPGHSCQALPDYNPYLSPASVWSYVDMEKAIPIHLKEEGYNLTGSVVFDDEDKEDFPTIEAGLLIREDEDWIVDIMFYPQLPSFSDKPKEFMFNAFISSISDNILNNRIDTLMRGKLVVLPGPHHSKLEQQS